MLTRCSRYLALAALAMAFAIPAVAHHGNEDPGTPQAPGAAAAKVSLQGYVDQIIVENRVTGSSRRFPVLAADDGRRFALAGPGVDALVTGTAIKVSGKQNGHALFPDAVQTIAAKDSRHALAKSAAASSVSGVLRLGHADNFDGSPSEFFFALDSGNGHHTRVGLAASLGVLKNGMHVAISGNVDASGELVPQTIGILALADVAPKSGPIVLAAPLTKNYLVIPVKFPNLDGTYGADPFTVAALNTAVFGGTGSVKEYYNEASYGQQLLSGAVADNGSGGFLQAGVAAPPCSNYTAIGTAAENAATGWLSAHGHTLAEYGGILYVFNNVSGCGWAGLAYVGYARAWSNSSTNLLVIAHELGHNFGLAHAASLDCGANVIDVATCSSSEYGDPFDVMGNNRAMHFNSAQKSILNWLPAGTVSTHTSGTATYTLSPLESAGGAHYAIKVPVSANRTYWIEYRQPIGYDAGLSSFPNNGAQIRVASPFDSLCPGCYDDTEFLDLTPGNSNVTDGALVVGKTFTDTAYNVSFNIVSATAGAGGQLTVQVTSAGGAPTTTTLASNSNPSISGGSVTFTATVTGTAPTGTINFTDSGTSIAGCASVALSGSGNTRTAACATSALTAGTHSIVAAYSGDAANSGSANTALSQSVKSTTTSGLASSANPSVVGASVTFTASVTGFAPTGNVNFTSDGASIAGCSAVALSGSGNIRTATCATSTLAAGTHSIAMAYAGDAGNVASTSSALSQLVNPAVSATTTALASSLNPSIAGNSVTFTAKVTGTAPTGSVNFKDGGTSIAGCSAVAFLAGSGNSRTATCATATLTAGTRSIVATYSGDAGNLTSTSTTLSQAVKSATSTTLASSGSPSTVGASVTFTASVTGLAPTGSVNFKDGGMSITGCAAVTLTGSGNIRTATCATSTLAAGTHSIAATYAGDVGNVASTSSALSQVINPGVSATSTALASSLNPSTAGTGATFTATVTGVAPTGSVNFTDGGTSIAGCAAAALTGSGNARTAACSTSALTTGTHSIVANYGGDAGNVASTSGALSQVVNAVVGTSTNVALASNGGVATASSTYAVSGYSFSAAAVNNGDRAGLNWSSGGTWKDATSASFPDWVQINFNGQKTIDHVIVYSMQDNYASPVDPSDALTFSLYGITDFQVQGWNGSAWVTLGSVAGNNLVKRAVTFTATTTDRIRINITGALANYSRITEIEAWTTGGTGPVATITALASSLNPSTAGTGVTFTATVTGAAPTGSVSFTDGGSSIAGCAAAALTGSGNTRTAACSTPALTTGTHSIVANYGGNAGNVASTSGALSQVVNAVVGTSTNVALASNGGVATASSTYAVSGYSFSAAAVNNGDRAGLNWSSGGIWKDATSASFPDWVQINFSGQKTIDRVIVYSLQDNYASPVDPSNTLTFSLYGITDFQVQGWNGSAWVTLGSVAGNNLVKRAVTFAATTTDRIRINITGALANYSRITEIEAWTN